MSIQFENKEGGIVAHLEQSDLWMDTQYDAGYFYAPYIPLTDLGTNSTSNTMCETEMKVQEYLMSVDGLVKHMEMLIGEWAGM